jgi:signal transduction histidine kinase
LGEVGQVASELPGIRLNGTADQLGCVDHVLESHAMSARARERLQSSPEGERPEAGHGGTEERSVQSDSLGSWRASWNTAGPQRVVQPTLLIAATVGAVLAAEGLPPAPVVDPRARVALETVIALSALVAGGRLIANFRRDHEWRGLLVLCTVLAMLLTDFATGAAPTLLGLHDLRFGSSAWLGGGLVAGVALTAAALSPAEAVAGPRELTGLTLVLSLGSAVFAGLLIEITASGASSTSVPHDDRAIALGIHTVSAVLLGLAAVAFLAECKSGDTASALLAGAAILLAGANLQYLAIPAPHTAWVTPREGFRLGAYALILGFAQVRHARLRREETYAALRSERDRIARDLHDGLAQDLACIAVQGQRLNCELGPEHPLMRAVRQALVVTRGVIADLTASTAPSTEAALRVVADELGHRFDVQVAVRVETAAGPDGEPDASQREHLVRIAREAIVNAALHGTARRVDVVLLQRGRSLLLRVSDDGRGMTDGDRSGFGVRNMRAHAASIGGRLNAQPRAGGGTELELRVS